MSTPEGEGGFLAGLLQDIRHLGAFKTPPVGDREPEPVLLTIFSDSERAIINLALDESLSRQARRRTLLRPKEEYEDLQRKINENGEDLTLSSREMHALQGLVFHFAIRAARSVDPDEGILRQTEVLNDRLLELLGRTKLVRGFYRRFIRAERAWIRRSL